MLKNGKDGLGVEQGGWRTDLQKGRQEQRAEEQSDGESAGGSALLMCWWWAGVIRGHLCGLPRQSSVHNGSTQFTSMKNRCSWGMKWHVHFQRETDTRRERKLNAGQILSYTADVSMVFIWQTHAHTQTNILIIIRYNIIKVDFFFQFLNWENEPRLSIESWQSLKYFKCSLHFDD